VRGTGDARLGAMLKSMRRADGRGLKESAHACGVSVSAMSAYERGEAQQRHLGHLAKLVDETRQQHDPDRAEERRRNASKGGRGETASSRTSRSS
jgi:transcriptional regulator with XRE-family HTH domain